MPLRVFPFVFSESPPFDLSPLAKYYFAPLPPPFTRSHTLYRCKTDMIRSPLRVHPNLQPPSDCIPKKGPLFPPLSRPLPPNLRRRGKSKKRPQLLSLRLSPLPVLHITTITVFAFFFLCLTSSETLAHYGMERSVIPPREHFPSLLKLFLFAPLLQHDHYQSPFRLPSPAMPAQKTTRSVILLSRLPPSTLARSPFHIYLLLP